MFDLICIGISLYIKFLNYILGVGFIDNIKLDIVRFGFNVGDFVIWVE